MVKKLYAILLIGCLVISLTACEQSKNTLAESRTLETFISTANSLGMSIVDACEQYEDSSIFQNVYVATQCTSDKSKNLWQIEYYVFVDESKAINVYNQQLKNAGTALNGENSNPAVKEGEYAEYCTDTTYFYMERTQNVIILAQTDKEYEKDVQAFIENLELMHQELSQTENAN